MPTILYISLTGMTEPLGRSQVLEYLTDLSVKNTLYLISFERKKDLETLDTIKCLTKNKGIQWHYFIYSNQYGLLSTLRQILKATLFASRWIKENDIQIIHARSIIPATIGMLLKKWQGIRLLFDIRGFAIDEKIDSGRLKKGSLLFYTLKKLDNYLYRSADHVVILTHIAKKILHKELNIPLENMTVIPTCASRDVFKVMNETERKAFKHSLGYKPHEKIILHTGTVTGWYDFDSEIVLVKEMIQQDKNVHLLILNRNEQQFIKDTLNKHAFPKENVRVSSSSFEDMYQYLSIADLSLFFIKPSYSKQASAPTKFAENVACRLLSVTNSNVGDASYYLQHYEVGHIVNLAFLKHNLTEVAATILQRISKKPTTSSDFDRLFETSFDKKIAVKKYQQIYTRLL